MLIQEFLKTHCLLDLEAEGIEYSLFDDNQLIQLNYNQITASESNKMACECRALILGIDRQITDSEIVGETVVVCRSFDRFFNLGQNNTVLNFSQPLTIFEKIDGSLINLYFYKNEWRTSSRSVWDGSNQINNIISFNNLVKKTLKEMNTSFEILISRLDKNYTYSFELTTPLNKVVVDYKDYRMTLLGCRDNKSGQQFSIDYMEHLGMPFPKKYNFHTMSEINDFIGKLEDHNFEGFVAMDRNFNRVKIKSPNYLLAHKIATKQMTDPNLLEAILLKIDDDISIFMNEIFIKRMSEIKSALVNYCKRSDDLYTKYKDLSRKDFALSIKTENVVMQYLFDMFTNKAASTLEAIHSKKVDNEFPRTMLLNLLEKLDLNQIQL
jgi:T4 RnlA family RNA ligase